MESFKFKPRPQPGDQIICKPPDKRSFYTGVVLSTNADETYDVEFAADGEYENEVCKNVKEVEEELDHHANAKELWCTMPIVNQKLTGPLGLAMKPYVREKYGLSHWNEFTFVEILASRA